MIRGIILKVRKGNFGTEEFKLDLSGTKIIYNLGLDYYYKLIDFFNSWNIVARIIEGNTNLLSEFKNDTYDLTLYLKQDLLEPIVYKILIDNGIIIYENLYYKDDLIISKSCDNKIAEIGTAWKYISDSDPNVVYLDNQTITYQPTLISIYKDLVDVRFLVDMNRQESIDILRSYSKALEDFQKVIPSLGFDITKVTDDLRFLSKEDPTGELITAEMRGTGFNRLFDLLPRMSVSFLDNQILLIPDLKKSLHPNLYKTLCKWYTYKSVSIGIGAYNPSGRIITYNDPD